MRTLILIDGKNAASRFGYAHRGLSHNGRPTGSLYGFCNILVRLKRKYEDAVFVVAWDEKTKDGKTWRHEILPTYKANRNKQVSPEQAKLRADVAMQLRPMQELAQLLDIPSVGVPGVEADDLIGILTRSAVDIGLSPVIYSSDKDYCQLMVYGVQVIRDVDKTNKLAAETEKSVFKSFCVPVKHVLKLRAMCGDHSDGIHGAIKGVAEKTAAKWIELGLHPGKRSEYGIPLAIPDKHSVKLKASWDTVRLNYRVMKIAREVDSSVFDESTQKQLRIAIDTTVAELEGMGNNQTKKRYKRLVAYLAKYGLEDAISNRNKLFTIQLQP